ncbi:MAG: stage V sporulation protein AD [Clostridia bacterium]|nr:stage V sporulation protein AD [Clostridia bacterium]
MSKRMGKQTVKLETPVTILASAAIAGQKEKDGPLGDYFDVTMENAEWNEETWEKTESKMQKEAVKLAVQKARLDLSDMNYVLAGDLLNQCIGAGFGLRELNIPFFGIYGACSTMIEGLSLGSMLIDGGFADHVAAVTSSHFCTAERQYRMPLEYGGQRTPTAQWTVTGSGSAVLGKDGTGPAITHITTGKIMDMGVKDANNMGGAMAPAAFDTLAAHFRDTGLTPADYDLILTGDLGTVGREILVDLMHQEGWDISDNYNDCGCMIYDIDRQDVHAGGSGCGCIGSTLCGYVLTEMHRGTWKRILAIGTGALLSTTSGLQGESVPAIAHLVAISMGGKE